MSDRATVQNLIQLLRDTVADGDLDTARALETDVLISALQAVAAETNIYRMQQLAALGLSVTAIDFPRFDA